MVEFSNNIYAQWRARACAKDCLRDERFPPERLVQAIWQHQRLRRAELKTLAGQSVRVFHPGFANLEGGPDFRGAVLQIGSESPCSGDVEVDLRTGGWRAHGHHRNPNFRNVLLHVVWDDAGAEAPASESRASHDASALPPAVLPLKDVLDAPLAELSLCLENESLRSLPESFRGKCCAPLRGLAEPELVRLLEQAARVRLETKAAQFRARAKNAGWEQALWENLFRALGYKHNVWPMQHIAEQRPRLLAATESVRSSGEMLLALQVRLLGMSGLLPDELTRAQKSTDNYVRRVWDVWWRERDACSDVILPRAAWRFHGLRPANHPSRRLALASHWLADKDFISKLENWIAADGADLMDVLQVARDEFWSWHWTFKSTRLKKQQPLLGAGRVTDLAVNVILPGLWIRAAEGDNEKIRNEVERRFLSWPAAEDNSILKLARQRLLGTSSIKIFKTAAAQQGLIQIVRDFCDRSNAVCDDCKFPDLIRELMASNKLPNPSK
ncbi:MAG TPA: DUF2851 family protein [Candidatus Sulfotelmatobacter sp.]|nr:DUF2851 family protein [Candidatus Sulfotelmatobacter sp.]